MSDAHTPVEVFCSHAPEDESYFLQLQKHLSVLTRQERIVLWHQRQITPGTDWAQAIDTHINRASVILLLISADFLASDYCYGVEMKHALERQRLNEACVLPILVRPVEWGKAPFKHLKVLPTNDKPITLWRNRDEAFKDVVQGISVALEEIERLTFGTLPSALSRLWNIPYAPNRFFTGQETLLDQLANVLKSGQLTALSQPQAISGLGGIGKTQIAVEYAYRHRQYYKAVFWVRADSHEALISGYVALAELLNLSEKDERNQTIIVQAVVQWLKTHREWLLIFDNADDLSIISAFLRSPLGGHVLLTTRAHAVGPLAQSIEVETMSQDVSVLFLLRRAGLIGLNASLAEVSASERATAQQITEALGRLPLALDQAGAYIEETGCGLASYLQSYQQRRIELLKKRGNFSHDYPESVATTWILSFEKIKRQSLAAVDLLRCCALLHPDAIPEELFTNGAIHLGLRLQRIAHDPLIFDDTVRVLLAYSLIRRDPTTTSLSIHRLVQAVLVDGMSAKIRKQWRERVIRAINATFPVETFGEWMRCKRLLAHVLVYSTWIEHEPIFIPEAVHVFHRAGIYLRERAQYLESELLLVRAFSILEQYAGAEHPHTAFSMNSLAALYRQQGKYKEAELLYVRALSIYELRLGVEHSDTATCINNLATLYDEQGKYEQAESLYKRALSIKEQQLGAEHPAVATSLNNLATLYKRHGKYEEAESLYKQALLIRERHLGSNHPYTASTLGNLGNLYQEQGKYREAEPLYEQALLIKEQQLGGEHPSTMTSLSNLAELYRRQGKDEEAELLYQRALAVYEQHLKTEHPNVAHPLRGLAQLYQHQGKYAEAEQLYQRALAIYEQNFGSEHPDTAYPLHGLAEVYEYQRKYPEAEPLYKRALAIREQRLGSAHPDTQATRKSYAAFLRIVGRDTEATVLDISHEQSTEGDY